MSRPQRIILAARARAEIREGGAGRPSLGDGADCSTFLGVAFPHDQVQILPYNRIVRDLGGLTPDAFMQAVRDRFELAAGSPMPAQRGEIAMYFKGSWHRLRPRVRPGPPRLPHTFPLCIHCLASPAGFWVSGKDNSVVRRPWCLSCCQDLDRERCDMIPFGG